MRGKRQQGKKVQEGREAKYTSQEDTSKNAHCSQTGFNIVFCFNVIWDMIRFLDVSTYLLFK